MSIVTTSNRWLNRLYKTVAILLVLLAVMISALRLFFPFVHHYKLSLQDYLNKQSQADFSIGTLSMTWQGSGPILIIGDVQVLETERASVFIKQLELQVDFWSTLSQQNLISKNLIISGAIVDISEQLWLGKAAENNPKETNEIKDVSVISDLFLNRINRFSIRNSQITVRNKTITRSIRLNHLRWLNTDGRHQGEGSVILNSLSSNNLQLKLDLQGEQGSKLTGKMYLQANNIDITPWLDKILVIDDDKTKTDINFSAWLDINNSKMSQLQVDFAQSSIHWQVGDKKQKLTLEQGQTLLVKEQGLKKFKLYSTPLSLQFNEQKSQQFSVMLAKEMHDFTLHLSEIDVSMVAELAPLIIAKEATRSLLSEMTLSGKIQDLFIRQNDSELQIVSDFSAFNNSYSHSIPGLENVSGSLSFVDNYLSVDFDAEQGKLDFDKLFVQAFPYDSFSGQLNAEFDEKGWALTVEELDFLSKEINLSAQIKVEVPVDGEVNLALLTHVSNGNAGLVGRYLPLPIMSESLVAYLNAAVVSGRIEDAQVLINGPISHFPFTDGSGIFVVDAELSQSEFKFVSSWPSITDFVANLNFTNNSMLITGRGGKLTGLDVTGIRAGIADLARGRILKVDALIKPTPASYIGNLMNESPLKNSVGSVLDQLQIAGNVSGSFDLNLPLNGIDKALATGTINFDNNQAALQTPRMDFNHINGQLSFSNDKISTQDLTLHWQGLPLSLNINGADQIDYYNTDINLTALWQETEWIAHIPQRLKQYTKGELAWQGNISLHQHHQGGFSYTANIDSDLNNTELLLPAPYQRNAEHKNHLSLQVNGGQTESKIALNYGDKMHFSGQLDHELTAFYRANLMFGEGSMALPSNGFHITTKLDTADFSQWQPLISDILESIDQSESTPQQLVATPLLAKPERIRGSIGQLEILGQTLTNVSFNLLDQPQWWLLQLNAEETRSQIKIYPDWLKQGVAINSEFLKLPKIPAEPEAQVPLVDHKPNKAENDIIFANISPLTFHCDSCIIGLLDLGEVDVDVKRINNELIEVTQFTAKRKDAELSLTGSWLHNEQESKTSLVGNLSVDDIETELKAMGFESVIRDSGAKVNIDVNWVGGPQDFTFNTLNGTVDGSLDDGYLAEVNDTAARIFSVLSLQSLVRKLTLDFRDIFSNGMFYSSIKGDYQLQDGMLTTDNTKMDGTAGNLLMTGHTNLVTGELAYDLSYKPNLTSSLPVLAWIATLNPVTFLAGVAIDQVIKSQVVSEFKFKLTGTVDKPDFQEVGRKKEDISVDNTLPIKETKAIKPKESADAVKSKALVKEPTPAPVIDKKATPVKALTPEQNSTSKEQDTND